MFAIVSADGKYHGHTPSEDDARKLAIVKDSKTPPRLLTDAEWAQVVAAPDDRAKLCASLGKQLS